MKDKLNPTLKGKIIITDAISGRVLYEKTNALQPYHLTSMINMLAGNIGYNPKTIKVWLSSVNIATSDIESYTVDVAGHWVKFMAFFDATDFSGPLDELTLECTGGTFSQATGLTFSKTGLQAIYVTWQITVS